MSNQKPLKILARRMFPQFVHEEYPQMITFMEYVFEYMDQTGGQFDVVSNLLNYVDVDLTLPKFEAAFRDQYLANFPDVLAADVDLLVKNILSFYLNRGTEQSYRFLFGALFDSTVNFKYPKFNILRASDGIWYTPQYLVLTDINDNIPPQLPDTTPFGVFKIIDKFITGTESGAVAFVDESVTLSAVGLTYGGNGNVEAISTVESEGTFKPGEQILIGNTIVQNGSFDQDTAFWTLSPANDRGFSTVNNQLVIKQQYGNIKDRTVSQAIDVTEGSQYWIRYTLAQADAAEARVTVGYAPRGIELYDSGDKGLESLPYSNTVLMPAVDPGKEQIYITLWNQMSTADFTATFDGISLVKEEYLNNVPILFVANIASESGVLTGDSKWKDIRGFLSEGDIDNDREIYLQDGDYYQDFSYEIKSEISVDRFESIVKDLLHPSGFKMFSTVVASDLYLTYAMRECWYDDLDFDTPLTVTRNAGSGRPFDSLFRQGDIVTIGLSSDVNYGQYVVDTVDNDHLVFRSGFSLAGGNYVGTPIKISAGIGVMPIPIAPSEYLTYEIEDPIGIHESYYTTLVSSGNIITKDANDGKDFDQWLIVGQQFTLGRMFNPIERGAYRVLAVTANTVTVDPVFRALTDTDHTGELLKITRSIIPHGGNSHLQVNFDIEYNLQHGFGVTWADMEARRKADNRQITDWASLIIGDFKNKATSRFGFIDPWEIDITVFEPPVSNDPLILWSYDEPAFLGGIDYGSDAYYNAYFYEVALNVPVGTPDDSTVGMYTSAENDTGQRVIAEAATPFSPGEYLIKWEKDVLYQGDWSKFTLNNFSNDGVWYDLYRANLVVESVRSTLDGVQHGRVQLWVAADDGAGSPVPGSEVWKHFEYYVVGLVQDWWLRDYFSGDITGTLLTAHSPSSENPFGASWIKPSYATPGDLEINPTGKISGKTAGENIALIDMGVGHEDMSVRVSINFNNETSNVAVGTRFISAGSHGYLLELDQSGYYPTLYLYEQWNGTRYLRDTVTCYGEQSYGMIGARDCDLQIDAYGDTIYGEFWAGQGNRRCYRVAFKNPRWPLFFDTETHALVRSDGINTNTLDEFWIGDMSEVFDRPRPITFHGQGDPAQPPGFIMYVVPAGSFKLQLPLDTGFPDYTPLEYDFWVDWGDGSAPDHITSYNQTETTHAYTYSATQRYPIHIYDVDPVKGMSFDYGASTSTNRLKVREIKQWGDVSWKNLDYGFERCSNMTIIAEDAPDLSNCISVEFMLARTGVTTLTAPSGVLPTWTFGSMTSLRGFLSNAVDFNGDVSGIQTTGIIDFNWMFEYCDIFEGTGLETWDVAAGETFYQMFYVCNDLVANLNGWNIQSATNTGFMFSYCTTFNSTDLTGWDMSNVTDSNNMFQSAWAFNGDVTNWIMPLNQNMSGMFATARVFNQDLSLWDTSSCTDMNYMFGTNLYSTIFNGNITGWDTSNVLNFNGMFKGNTAFNQNISGWNVTKCENFQNMFSNADAFNQPIGAWTLNTTTPVDMRYMFENNGLFNQDLSGWDVSNVLYMNLMFKGSVFNSSLAGWDVSGCVNFSNMFELNSAFNQDISGWTLNNVDPVSLSSMFKSATAFNRDLSSWDVSTVTSVGSMFYNADAFNSPLPSAWPACEVFDYMFAYTAIYNQNIGNWTFGNSQVSLRGMFQSAVAFDQSLTSWDVTKVYDFSNMFDTATAFNSSLAGWLATPYSGTVISDFYPTMEHMFDSAVAFNQPINTWDVSGVKEMDSMFYLNEAFNQPLNNWDVSNVTTFLDMFRGSLAFNSSLAGWDVSSATTMWQMFRDSVFNQPIADWTLNTTTACNLGLMFYGNTVFNQSLSTWNVSTVVEFGSMFYGATAFNGSLAGWTTTAAGSMDYMFFDATAFNQDVSHFDFNGVFDVREFLGSTTPGTMTFSVANYDLLLNAMSLQTLNPSEAFHVDQNYTIATSQAARDIITTAPNSWTITDLGGI